jgi:carbonic anhydrase
MHDLSDLVHGYGRFVSTRDSQETHRFRMLAEQGQSPKHMVISCCDSRVDPTLIFDAKPGELFVVRNVANLVPPFEPHGDYHGTSAALEFAVTGLGVENILVMGHAQCGGVQAFLEGPHTAHSNPSFIGQWMSLLNPARARVPNSESGQSAEKLRQALEFEGIRCSLENLRTFPFVTDAMARGELSLRGAYFSIFDGSLLGMDPENSDFRPIVI